jgi:hypothetical protein
MTYPDGIDALVNVNATDSLAAGGHAARHNSVNTALVEVKDYLVGALGSKLDVAGGKILQIVRATDTTARTTSSTSFVDANLSVTITPQFSSSAVLLIASYRVLPASLETITVAITDASNNAISGAESALFSSTGVSNMNGVLTLFARATPATENAVTYKTRFLTTAGTATLRNNLMTGQLYAIEVSA